MPAARTTRLSFMSALNNHHCLQVNVTRARPAR
jgi:hypothetical protein